MHANYNKYECLIIWFTESGQDCLSSVIYCTFIMPCSLVSCAYGLQIKPVKSTVYVAMLMFKRRNLSAQRRCAFRMQCELM